MADYFGLFGEDDSPNEQNQSLIQPLRSFEEKESTRNSQISSVQEHHNLSNEWNENTVDDASSSNFKKNQSFNNLHFQSKCKQDQNHITKNKKKLQRNYPTQVNETEENKIFIAKEDEDIIETDNRVPITPQLLSRKDCVMCDYKSFKYKCPFCLLCTCSLACVKAHKTHYRCNGINHSLRYKRLSQMDESQIREDFFFLESCTQSIDAMRRDKRNIVQSLFELPKWLKKLKYEAFMRRTNLKILPAGFTRRRQNKTAFMYSSKEIHWDVEFIFPNIRLSNKSNANIAKHFSIVNHRISEKTSLQPLLAEYLKPSDLLEHWKRNRALKPYHDAKQQNIVTLFKLNRNRFIEVCPNKCLRDLLADRIVIEYPTFWIVLRSELPKYEVVDEAQLLNELAIRHSIKTELPKTMENAQEEGTIVNDLNECSEETVDKLPEYVYEDNEDILKEFEQDGKVQKSSLLEEGELGTSSDEDLTTLKVK